VPVVEEQDLHAAGPEEIQVALERARLADHEAGDLKQQDRAGAELARRQRRVQRGARVGRAAARVPQRGDLAVRYRVALLHPLVVPGAEHLAARREDRADRHPADREAGPGLLKGQRHQFAV